MLQLRFFVIFCPYLNMEGKSTPRSERFFTFLPIDNVLFGSVGCSSFLTVKIFHHQNVANLPWNAIEIVRVPKKYAIFI